MPRISNAEIRARVIAEINRICQAGVDGRGTSPLTLGSNWVRRGRWVLCDTTTNGVFIACEVTDDGRGVAGYAGPAGQIRTIVPATVRQAWIAGQYGEADNDP